MKSLSNVQRVKFILKKLSQELLTEFLIENNNRGNIRKLLEITVEKLAVRRFKKAIFEEGPLAELFEITAATCQKIEGVQSYCEAFYFHPKLIVEGGSKIKT